MEKFFTKSIDQTLSQFGTTSSGLESEEAQKRLEKIGPNILPQKKKKNKFLIFLSQFCDVMIIILLIAAIVSIVVAIFQKNYSEIIDGIIILLIVFLNAIIGFYEHQKAEKDMLALQKQTSQICKVRRAGNIVSIDVKDVVVGDVVVLSAGDIIPADLRLISSASLKCDESSLTGESVPVEKNCNKMLQSTTPLAERCNMAYRGCVVTYGRGEGVVVCTGKDTELGKIALSLVSAKKELTPLQKSIKVLGRIITVIVLIVAILTFILEMLLKTNPDVMEAFLTAVAIAVAAIPESLPAVITIIMSIGVSNLSKKKAIVKNLSAVETLGSTSVICSDKTGTLTENKMTVKKLYYSNNIYNSNNISLENISPLTKVMLLCNDTDMSTLLGDPTESALVKFLADKEMSCKKFYDSHPRVSEIPFDSNRKLMTTLNKFDDKFCVCTKGAVDEILKRCTHILIDDKTLTLTDKHKKDILSVNHDMANQALRVLGFATKNVGDKSKFSEDNLTFVGLVGMIDPPRKEAKQAVQNCKKAHMRPIMITGDHKDTAFAIAKEIGICNDISELMLGSTLDNLSDEEFLKVIDKINVYARVSPENKVRIVKTLKNLGNVVAMTGDGVNDAPSLSEANIGVGMGITGTDVTKEVADMIVTDDNFATIVVAVKEGRRIYANIKKTVAFLFTANLGEIMALLLATIFFPQFTFLTPVQILFVNLITDSLPAVALGLEKADKNIMLQKPRSQSKTIFSDGMGWQIAIMGFVQTLCVILAYYFSLSITSSALVASSVAFYTLNFVQFGYLLSIKKSTFSSLLKFFDNKWILYAIAFGGVVMLLLAVTPFGNLLDLVFIPYLCWLIILGFAVLTFILSEIVKIVINKVHKNV